MIIVVTSDSKDLNESYKDCSFLLATEKVSQ